MPRQERGAERTKWRLPSPADNPLVRAVGRLPTGVHGKLLVAFVGTALLVVGIGLLGLRLLGQSNERVETLGTLQERAFAYGKLRSDALRVRLLVSENAAGDFNKFWREAAIDVFGTQLRAEAQGAARLAVDATIVNAVAEVHSSTFPDI